MSTLAKKSTRILLNDILLQERCLCIMIKVLWYGSANLKFARELGYMKEYQSLIGKIIIAVAIVIAGIIIANAIANAIEAGCANIGSQIASAISFS